MSFEIPIFALCYLFVICFFGICYLPARRTSLRTQKHFGLQVRTLGDGFGFCFLIFVIFLDFVICDLKFIYPFPLTLS